MTDEETTAATVAGNIQSAQRAAANSPLMRAGDPTFKAGKYVGFFVEVADDEEDREWLRGYVLQTFLDFIKTNAVNTRASLDEVESETDVVVRYRGEDRSFTWAEFEEYIGA